MFLLMICWLDVGYLIRGVTGGMHINYNQMRFQSYVYFLELWLLECLHVLEKIAVFLLIPGNFFRFCRVLTSADFLAPYTINIHFFLKERRGQSLSGDILLKIITISDFYGFDDVIIFMTSLWGHYDVISNILASPETEHHHHASHQVKL